MIRMIAVFLALAINAHAGVDPSNKLKLGDGTGSNKIIEFNKGSTATNPSLRWNNGTSKLQFSNDNSLFTDLGGGGSSARTVTTQTGTTYTFQLNDGSASGANPITILSNASTVTATVPSDSSVAFPVGSQIDVIVGGAGKIVMDPEMGVTINSPNGDLAVEPQYGFASLIKTASNVWNLTGDLGLAYITATGGSITTDGDYKVHTFTTSGTFTITSGSGTVESLVVAGGGGGGGITGGGAGAGGVLYTTPGAVYEVGAYTVTVGAGGAPVTSGGFSAFDALTATGGGAGGSNGLSGSNGGSGGGAGSYLAGPALTGGTGTGGQGNNGGNSNTSTADSNPGAGGGGAGAVGQTVTVTTLGGNGGNGLSNSITGSAVTYGGGGGGGVVGGTGGTPGAGGTGGGGAGGNGGNGTDGTDGLGGGGGGASNTGTGGNGGDGVVVLRYKFQ